MVWSTEKSLVGMKIASRGKLLVVELMLVVVVVVFISSANGAPTTADLKSRGCMSMCGNLKIEYPFGDKEGCCFDKSFLISCYHSKPYLQNSNILLSNISVEGGEAELHILKKTAYGCYKRSSNSFGGLINAFLLLSKFNISTKNKLTAIGCDTLAFVRSKETNDTTGCLSQCSSPDHVDQNGTCSGFGCCQVSIPKGLSSINLEIRSFNNHTNIWQFNPCSHAFLVEPGYNFTFYKTYLQDFSEKRMPMILDWAIENKTCQEAVKNPSSYACGGNASCIEPENARGSYICKCLAGYGGNPYLSDGCQDINECDKDNDCIHKDKCKNTLGNYTCSCPKGYHGDGRKNGKSCSADPLLVIQIVIGFSIGVVVVLMSSSWLYWIFQKRKLVRLKEKFFRQNGGLMLQQQLAQQNKPTQEVVKIFTSEELKQATNNYDDSRIIGRGGNGTVYKGILVDERIVAIKKSKMVDQNQIEQFINEVVVLSQINHRNVVKLLGCCLETQVPLLVYEFITNGTLFEHIHNVGKTSVVSWKIRLQIAAETAGVLAYLHGAASVPIIHRDIKTTNILLDDNYTAKVSDFGASRLIPLDQIQLATVVQGTLGYLDPEYLQTSQLTEKSDVYSFGVVLVELITGKKALSFDRPEEERCLAMYFLSSLNKDAFYQVIDKNIVTDKDNSKEFLEVANLAKRCLKVKGDERPTMKEVAMELEGLIMEKHPWVGNDKNNEETKYLLGETSSVSYGFGDSNTTVGFDSIREHMPLPWGSGR